MRSCLAPWLLPRTGSTQVTLRRSVVLSRCTLSSATRDRALLVLSHPNPALHSHVISSSPRVRGKSDVRTAEENKIVFKRSDRLHRAVLNLFYPTSFAKRSWKRIKNEMWGIYSLDLHFFTHVAHEIARQCGEIGEWSNSREEVNELNRKWRWRTNKLPCPTIRSTERTVCLSCRDRGW